MFSAVIEMWSTLSKSFWRNFVRNYLHGTCCTRLETIYLHNLTRNIPFVISYGISYNGNQLCYYSDDSVIVKRTYYCNLSIEILLEIALTFSKCSEMKRRTQSILYTLMLRTISYTTFFVNVFCMNTVK